MPKIRIPLNMKSEINEENIRNLKRAVTVKLLNDIQTEYADEMTHPTDTPYNHVYTGKTLQSSRLLVEQSILQFYSKAIKFLEYGTASRNVMPPYSAISRWVRLKLGITGKKELRKTTYALMTAIKNKGTPVNNQPYAPIRKAIERVIRKYS